VSCFIIQWLSLNCVLRHTSCKEESITCFFGSHYTFEFWTTCQINFERDADFLLGDSIFGIVLSDLQLITEDETKVVFTPGLSSQSRCRIVKENYCKVYISSLNVLLFYGNKIVQKELRTQTTYCMRTSKILWIIFCICFMVNPSLYNTPLHCLTLQLYFAISAQGKLRLLLFSVSFMPRKVNIFILNIILH